MRVFAALADDNVVDQVDADDFGGFSELTRDLYISATGGGVATRVVVHRDDGGGAELNGFFENFSRMH